MSYIWKAGILGIGAVMLLSIVLTFFVCSSIAEDSPQIKCNSDYTISIFLRIYEDLNSMILLVTGFVAGALVGRLMNQLKEKADFYSEKIGRQTKQKRFLWMWEYK